MPADTLPLLDSFSRLADPTRCRMLWLLDQQELTVSELCAVLQLPQSTVSRHLKTLADADWVSSRRDGTSRYYALAVNGHVSTATAAGRTPRDAKSARAQIWALTRAAARRPSGRRAGSPAARARPRAAERDVAAVLRHVGRAVGSPARGAVRRRLRDARPRRAAAGRLDGRRSGLRHRRDARDARAARRARHRRRRVRRDARRRAQPARWRRQRRSAARDRSRRCRSTRRPSMRRR